jgi:hypothetical protein
MVPPARPALRELWIADSPDAWEALGFTVDAGALALGGIRIVLGGEGQGITAWSVDGAAGALDGLQAREPGPPADAGADHPNGAHALDHVVVTTPDFDRTAAALDAAGMPLRRVRDAGGFRQGFRRLGPAILELVELREASAGDARFWGLVVIVADLDALADRLGPLLRPIKPAVQPGRRIATLDRSAGLSPQIAFMDAEGPAP